jgi:hypothetical protein
MTQLIRLFVPETNFLGGGSLLREGRLYFGDETILAVVVERELSQVSIYIADEVDRQAVVDFVLAHIPYSTEPTGAFHGITIEEAEQWIDDHVGAADTAAEVKAAVIIALKAIARRILTG